MKVDRLKIHICVFALVAGFAALALCDSRTFAQGRGDQGQPATGRGAVQGGTQAPAAPVLDPTKPHKLDIIDGSKARFRVQEQLAGINFPSEAVGTTEAVN